MSLLNESYNLLFKLGYGEFGEVWKGESLSSSKQEEQKNDKYDVAIKIFKRSCKDFIINNELSINEKVMQLNKETSGLTSLVKVYGVDFLAYGSANDVLRKTIVMEFLAGGELFERIVNLGSFSEKEAAHTIHALVSALDNLHKHHIIHRDLKPENVVFRSKDINAAPVIVDFGFAVIGTPESSNPRHCLYHDKNARIALGTPGYIAPESYSHSIYLNKSDMWSLGIICYIILVGFPPFDSKDQFLKERTLRGKFYPLNSEPWGHISAEAKDLVSRLICVNPAERFDAQQVLQHPWISRHNIGMDVSTSYSNPNRSMTLTRVSSNTPRLSTKVSINSALDSKPVTDSADVLQMARPRSERKDSDSNTQKLDSKTENETTADFGEDYVKRISRMSNRRKLKKTLNTVIGALRFRTVAIQHVLRTNAQTDEVGSGMDSMLAVLGKPGGGDYAVPPLSPSTSANTALHASPGSPHSAMNSNFVVTTTQLGTLQDALLVSIPSSVHNLPSGTPSRSETVAAYAKSDLHRLDSSVLRLFQTNGGLNFDEFCSAVKSVGLHVLASKQIFDIFDMDGSGLISPLEFLSTLAHFHEDFSVSVGDQSPRVIADKKVRRTKLFFSIFDQDGNGTISRTELENVVAMLLYDHTAHTEVDVLSHVPDREFYDKYDADPVDVLKSVPGEAMQAMDIPDTFNETNSELDYKALFDSIDTDRSGEICFDEFSAWFNKHDERSLFSRLLDPIQAVERHFRLFNFAEH
jgi:serine/threonine protein kinase